MRPASVLARELWRLSWRDRLLLLETIFCLALAALAIAVLPFTHLGLLASFPVCGQAPPQQRRLAETRRVRWAVVACARRVPWRAMCFQQGLAAQFMLRRRGIPSVLSYGVAPDNERGLSAHVWVRDRDVDIIGGAIASRYAVLATFPPQIGNAGSRGVSWLWRGNAKQRADQRNS
jgi:hypothetical protein